MIIRNDDVNLNTDFMALDEVYAILRDMFPKAELWSCVTLFSRKNNLGAIYPQIPFKNKPFEYFLEVDQICDRYNAPEGVKVVSHGLWHLNHTKIHPELQEASIVTSCNILNTDTFVPPFNAWDKDTERICLAHDIDLVKFEDGWRSIEHNSFNPSYPLWYMHSWMWDINKLVQYFQAPKV